MNEDDRKHNHYFIDVRGLDFIDPYMIAYLYGIDDPSGATQHALKKLLVSGKRGHKDELTDLSNVVDTTSRLIEIKKQITDRITSVNELINDPLTLGNIYEHLIEETLYRVVFDYGDLIKLQNLVAPKSTITVTLNELNEQYKLRSSGVGK